MDRWMESWPEQREVMAAIGREEREWKEEKKGGEVNRRVLNSFTDSGRNITSPEVVLGFFVCHDSWRNCQSMKWVLHWELSHFDWKWCYRSVLVIMLSEGAGIDRMRQKEHQRKTHFDLLWKWWAELKENVALNETVCVHTWERTGYCTGEMVMFLSLPGLHFHNMFITLWDAGMTNQGHGRGNGALVNSAVASQQEGKWLSPGLLVLPGFVWVFSRCLQVRL